MAIGKLQGITPLSEVMPRFPNIKNGVENKMEKVSEKEKEEIKQSLRAFFEPQIKKAKDNSELPVVYGIVKDVSRSGMNRTITFFTIQGNKKINLDWEISRLCDYPKKDSTGIRVSGCGMNMVFSVVYDLASTLWNTEEAKALGFVSGRNGSKQPENDGGYLLRMGD